MIIDEVLGKSRRKAPAFLRRKVSKKVQVGAFTICNYNIDLFVSEVKKKTGYT
ncbi:MAG: hypothetical protein GY847_25690 [Proteobacteria bacterium]|nr:hypothetical protein [Pseudomonadota bacterium]